MHVIANTFADRFNASFGIPAIRPQVGESFDRNNDLFLVEPGVVEHRDGHITRGSDVSVIYDALIEYNRRHMRADAFADHYADDPSECGFLS